MPSALGDCLLELWAFGELSATRVQQIAARAVEDRSQDPALLRDLAELGTGGRHKNNIHKELSTLVSRMSPQIPAPMSFHVPLVYKPFLRGPGQNVPAAHSMHLPFEWFSFMYKDVNASFRKCFVGGQPGEIPDLLETFWNGIPDGDLRKVYLRSEFRKCLTSSMTDRASDEPHRWCCMAMECHVLA